MKNEFGGTQHWQSDECIAYFIKELSESVGEGDKDIDNRNLPWYSCPLELREARQRRAPPCCHRTKTTGTLRVDRRQTNQTSRTTGGHGDDGVPVAIYRRGRRRHPETRGCPAWLAWAMAWAREVRSVTTTDRTSALSCACLHGEALGWEGSSCRQPPSSPKPTSWKEVVPRFCSRRFPSSCRLAVCSWCQYRCIYFVPFATLRLALPRLHQCGLEFISSEISRDWPTRNSNAELLCLRFAKRIMKKRSASDDAMPCHAVVRWAGGTSDGRHSCAHAFAGSFMVCDQISYFKNAFVLWSVMCTVWAESETLN